MAKAKSQTAVLDRPPTDADRPKKHKKSVVVVEKDAEEEDLERLVLGDKAGFRAQLFFQDDVDDAEDTFKDLSLAAVPADEEDTGLAELDDNIVFFTDDALLASADPNAAAAMVAAPAGAAGDGDADADGDKNAPAWHDSDDDRLRVSLVRQPRLRKLRRFEGEDIVSGTDYVERLRQQFLRLHPQPDWATEAQTRREERESGAQRARKNKSQGDDDSSDEEEDDEDDDGLGAGTLPLEKFFRSAGSMLAGGRRLGGPGQGPDQRKRRLRQPETLAIQRMPEMATKMSGQITSVAFHPRFAVLLTSSTSSQLHLHQLAPSAAPTPNPLLTSVRVRGLPIRRAAFLGPEGERVVFAGSRPYFHTWHLASGDVQRITGVQGHHEEHRKMDHFCASPDGRHLAVLSTENRGGGRINILSAATMQWVAQVHLDSTHGIADFVWWRNSAGLTVLGRDGRVGEWSMAVRRYVGVWRDEGSTGGTVLALGGRGGPEVMGGDRWVAVGARSGIVNVYERQALIEPVDAESAEASSDDDDDDDNDDDKAAPALPTLLARPTPRRCFEQLTTSVSQLVFSPDGQLLVFASVQKHDALRLAHLPSCTVYRNWPTEKTPIGRVTAVAFGPNSDMLAVCNDRGRSRVWEILD